MTPDFAVIGGGIVGCSLAAFLAEAGASVVLYEREAVAAGASGRNSGVVQHPLDAALVGLYEESLEHYRALEGFELPAEPAGLLLVTDRPEALEAPHAEFPELAPVRLEGAELRAAEPALAPGLAAYRLETGRPVPPAAAARAFAARAQAAGAQIHIGAAYVASDGVTVDGVHHPAGAVAVAAGPWTPQALKGSVPHPATALKGSDPLRGGGSDLPIGFSWGVVVELSLADPPRHVLEEAGIEALTTAGAPDALFSAVTARGVSAIGSTFDDERPDPAARGAQILDHAARFLPGVTGARITGRRACARPRSADGRPLLGLVDERVAVASGHGAWGVTLGPASARLVADQLLGRPAEIPPELSVTRCRSE